MRRDGERRDRDFGTSIGDLQHDIGGGARGLGAADTLDLDRVIGGAQARGIDDAHRHAADDDVGIDEVARGSGQGGDNGSRLSGQAIEQGGLGRRSVRRRWRCSRPRRARALLGAIEQGLRSSRNAVHSVLWSSTRSCAWRSSAKSMLASSNARACWTRATSTSTAAPKSPRRVRSAGARHVPSGSR